MAEEPNEVIIFELNGKSLNAALCLQREIKRELQTFTVKNTGPVNEIVKSFEDFYAGLLRRMRREFPEILDMVGLNSPATQVLQDKDSLPRSYKNFPEIFVSPENPPRYFMYAPVDYKGEHFTPADGVRLDEKQEKHVGNMLFMGGWGGTAPLVSFRREGVALPQDYKPLPQDQSDDKTVSYISFVAQGRSLAAVHDFEQRTEAYHAAVEKVQELVEKAAAESFPQLLLSLPAGEELRAEVNYRYGGDMAGKTEILLSVRQEGKTDLWNMGKTVPVPAGPYYTLTESYGGEYIVTARTDTQEGRQLAALMDAIPPTPSLKDYPEILGDVGSIVNVRKLGGMALLVFHAKDAQTVLPCPQDAKPLSTQAFHWLRADEDDRNIGIKPPPMPEAVAAVLGSLTQKPPKAPKPPKP